MKTIGEAAKIAGVSTDTLRHWDRIGLLVPSDRSAGGYRQYNEDDVSRLHQVMTWKSLGFTLSQIQAMIDDPHYDRAESLRRQKALAAAQLDRFHAITHGLESAVATAADHPRPPDSTNISYIATFASLSGRATAPISATSEPDPGRVVATNPIRLGESLMALGILPVATGTHEDLYTEQRGSQPWPPLVEESVRRRIADVGYYGTEALRIREARPDLILDLSGPQDCGPDESMVAFRSEGHCGLETLRGIANTCVVPNFPDHDHELPAFQHFLMATAQLVGRTGRALRLLETWEARMRALRFHLEGIEVGVVADWDERNPFEGCELFTPLAGFPTNILPRLGVDVVPPDTIERVGPRFLGFARERIADIHADTVFLNTRYRSREQVAELVESPPFQRMPAAQHNRVFGLGWDFVSSGWFSTHWQMLLIAHAFGLTPLRAGSGETTVLAVLDAARGRLSLAGAHHDLDLVLHGPGVRGVRLDAPRDGVTGVDLPHSVVADLRTIPEAYWLTIASGSAEARFLHDREGALDRLNPLAQAA